MTESNGTKFDTRQSSKSKLAKLLVKYELPELGAELEARWTADPERRMSLRDLADFVNKELLAASLDDPTLLQEEIKNYYLILTNKDASSGTRVQVKNQLAEAGVDVEQLLDDFVSRQAVHTYLTKERNTVYETRSTDRNDKINARVETIQRLKNRVRSVAKTVIIELQDADLVSTGNLHITVIINVECHECEQQCPVTEFLREGGCNCDSSG